MVSPPRAYAFPLATFHVCVLALVFVALAYPGMGGVDELNTALGLAIFGLLWAASFYGTAWALDDVRVHAIDVAFRRGIGGGARSGVIVALAGVLPAALLGSDGSVAGALGIALIYGALATLAAALVGVEAKILHQGDPAKRHVSQLRLGAGADAFVDEDHRFAGHHRCADGIWAGDAGTAANGDAGGRQ